MLPISNSPSFINPNKHRFRTLHLAVLVEVYVRHDNNKGRKLSTPCIVLAVDSDSANETVVGRNGHTVRHDFEDLCFSVAGDSFATIVCEADGRLDCNITDWTNTSLFQSPALPGHVSPLQSHEFDGYHEFDGDYCCDDVPNVSDRIAVSRQLDDTF